MSDHTCDTGCFDRTLCPEPCNMMHSYCTYCGARQDPCAHVPMARPTLQDVAREIEYAFGADYGTDEDRAKVLYAAARVMALWGAER